VWKKIKRKQITPTAQRKQSQKSFQRTVQFEKKLRIQYLH